MFRAAGRDIRAITRGAQLMTEAITPTLLQRIRMGFNVSLKNLIAYGIGIVFGCN